MLVPGEGPFAERLRAQDCSVETLAPVKFSSKHKPAWEIPRYLTALPRVMEALRGCVDRNPPDLIYANGPRFLPAVAWIARQYGIPLLFHAHNRILQRSALMASGRALAASKANVISCCAYVSEPLRTYVASERIRIVYNGTTDLRAPEHIRSRLIRNIGVVGRIAPEKGQLEFVRAVRLLAELIPSGRFLVIGGSSYAGEPYFSKVLCESRELPVVFAGWNDDAAAIMRSLDLLVVPSRPYDATPRVVLEAFSAGVPVVAFSSGGIPELVHDNVTGLLAREHTVHSLASRVFDAVQMHDAEMDRIAANARSAWRTRFHIERYREAVCETVVATTQAAMGAAIS